MKKVSLIIKSILLNTTILSTLAMGAQQVHDGLVYYGGDGITAHRERYVLDNGQRVNQPHGDLPEHKSSTIHYAEAFYKNQARIPLARQGDSMGAYRYDGLIGDNFHPSVRDQHLIYSDGASIFEPHVTQELWTRAQGTPNQEDVRFLISSHKDYSKLHWTPGKSVETANGHLPAGLYQFISAENLTEQVPHNQNNVVGVETKNFRREKWQKIGTDQFFTIKMPAHHLVSVAGMPEYVVNDFPSEPQDFLDLKNAIENYERTVVNNVDLQRPLNRIIFIGEARVGKDAVAQYYAGSDLTVTYNRAFRPARIELQGAPQLGTLNVISGIIGSRVLGSWFDQAGQRVVLTTPGINGVEKALEDILNVLSIKTLLTKNNPSKFVATIKESDFFEANYRNLNEVLKQLCCMFGYRIKDDGTIDMGRVQDLKNALSLVISQTDRSTRDDLVDGFYTDGNGVQQPVKGLLKNIYDIMQGSPQNYDGGTRSLLEFLSNHPERVSFFSVPNGNAQYAPRDPQNSRQAIQESIDVADGNVSRFMTVQNPNDIHIVFKQTSKEFIQKVLGKLNDQVTKYLCEDAVQKVWNLYTQKIAGHEGTVDALRDDLLVFSNKFNNATTQTLENFVQDIEALIGTNGVTRNIAHIAFLEQKLGVEAQYARDQWLAPLAAVMNTIRYSCSKNMVNGAPDFNPLNGINYFFDSQAQELTIVGYLIGLTDVAKLVENNVTKDGFAGITPGVKIKKLNLFSLRDLLLDSNFSLREATVVGIAPEVLQTVQSVTMDLRGRAHDTLGKAADNTAGTPGMHGRNGGNLTVYANNFKDVYKAAHPQNATKFEIKMDGSSGQSGQEGGNNTSVPGEIVGNAGGWNESSSTAVSAAMGVYNAEKDRYHVSALKVKGGTDEDRKGHFGPWYKDHLSIDYVKKEYREAGVKGTKGNRGFAGGVKGLKGNKGLLNINCPNLTSYSVVDTPPEDGVNGKGGSGSAGGAGGKVNYKITYTYRPGKYNHNGTQYWANAETGTTILGDGGRYREEAPRLLDNERGATGDSGDAGAEGANTTGQATQTAQLTTDELETLRDNKLQTYSGHYYLLASDPVKQKLLGKFTSLPAQ